MTYFPQANAGPQDRADHRVWDRFVRAFHWGLVACVAVAAFSGFLLGSTWISLHLWAGLTAMTLIAARVIWGFSGSAPARFAHFVRSPGKVLGHLQALRRGDARRYLGHNPLGAVMVLALILMVAALAASGVVALGGLFKTGPAAAATPYSAGRAARDLHEALALAILALIGLHLGGVLHESRRTAENLTLAMITGRKTRRAGDAPVEAVRGSPFLAAAIFVAVLLAATTILVTLGQVRVPGLPVAKLLPVYAAECGACHAAFNPSLLPRDSWARLMRGLNDHFGEDASLDAAETHEISAWLAANAAETADTHAANGLRKVNPAQPYSITGTAFWTRMHASQPESVFHSPAVGGRGNCAACHGDAEKGLFYPGRINVPKEALP